MVSFIFIYLLLLISLLLVHPAVSDCPKPTKERIDATGGACLQGNFDNSITFTCLAAGNTQDMYRSVTVLLHNGTGTYELVMQCPGNEWSNDSCMSVSADVTNVAREDCLVCMHSNSSSEPGASCNECPSMCRGSGRCISETTCCPFYDGQGSCTDSCSTGQVNTTDYKCHNSTDNPTESVSSKGGISVAAFIVILVILILLLVVLTGIIIVFLGKMRAHRKIAKYIIEGNFKSMKSCIPRSNKGQEQQNGEVETRRTSRPYVACTTLKESPIELTEEEEKGPPLPPRSISDAEVGYQKIVTTTKRSVHLYNPVVNRSTSLPRQPSSDDGYVDLRKRSQTIPHGEYVELDYQRSRKGRKGKGDMVKTQSAAAITRMKIRGKKGACADDDGEEFEYSYPKMSPRLKRKIEKMQQKGKPAPQPKPTAKPKKGKKMVKAPSEDQDGYVATSEIQELKARARLQKEATLDQDGYVATAVVHEMKEEEVKERPKLHRGVVDQEGYVDCIILEEPKASGAEGPAKKKRKDEKGADERAGPSQSSLRKLWEKKGFGFRK
ncbi:PREDICTED: uncharacterized protein LOC109583775 [Amphimedon queenslandica]|uniref:TNFR-Cys domain-containing protein n=1 Tax=Amphimedon queenslandica TaxID=400682 RepID=A0AAN0JDH7_AMPQE|nr:PREDICTED: uncharacterized protein LOC109583775 [Amphimedon queenslandica]|eukprot:XP_019854792.1 PREDICTED: uncharacterized protein LOC109583775 [Amphimedon queenslandica]